MSTVTEPSQTFGQMTILNKLLFTVKLCVFLVSFGFAFPTLLSA